MRATSLPGAPRARLAAVTAAALALAATACSETFTPPSVVEDRRVLALVADPPELDGTVPGASTTVRAVEAEPPGLPAPPAGTTLERRWTFCPFSLGPATGYACAVPQCEVPLAPDAGGAVTVEPVALAVACLQDPAVVLPPELAGGALPDRVEVLVRWRLVDVTGATEAILREAVQRVPVWTQAPTAALNHPPAFAALDAVQVGGAPAQPCGDTSPAGLPACPVAGALSSVPLPVGATVDPDTIEAYAVGTREATETFALTFFTTAGRFDDDRAAASKEAPTATVRLKREAVPAGTTDALLWVVLRDLRGGQAVAGPFRLAVISP